MKKPKLSQQKSVKTLLVQKEQVGTQQTSIHLVLATAVILCSISTLNPLNSTSSLVNYQQINLVDGGNSWSNG